jgi:tripeptide aminopeptidase
MLDRFVRLCEIASPTGSERAVADAVLGELQALGAGAEEDGAAGLAGAGAGNLIVRIPGEREEWIMLASHLDTVPHDGEIEVALDQGVFRSRGDTILGADNKAAVTVLVELAARYADRRPPIGLGWASGGEGARSGWPSLAHGVRARPREPDRGDLHRRPDL